jgi:hypothetical protein
MDELSERRLAENEVIFREVNKSVQEFIEKDLYNAHSGPLHFYCECSNAACRQRVALTAQKYKELHQNSKRFVVVRGHELPEIEKVIQQEDGYAVVEKYGDPPTPEELSSAVKSIKV